MVAKIMGLYPIDCFLCHKPFLWWSGNMDQRCTECTNKAAEQVDIFLDQVDKSVNKTPLKCGHKPCTLGHCMNCEKHCQKRKKDK